MTCPECGARWDPIVVSVPSAIREAAPADRVAVCRRCLRLQPTDAEPTSDSSELSDGLPSDTDAVAGIFVAISLLDALAHNREAIDAVVTHVERSGVDAVLTLQRLVDEPTIEPYFDLSRRIRQLEEFR